MKPSEEAALRCLQAQLFEALRKQQLYAHMCDSIADVVRNSTDLVLEINEATHKLGQRLALRHDEILKILSEVDQ